MKKWLKDKKDITSKEAEEDTPSLPQKTVTKIAKPQQDRPRICLLDVNKEIVKTLIAQGFNCEEGTFGYLIDVPNKVNQEHTHICLLNNKFPDNLHEFDIVIIDLQHPTIKPYDSNDHTHIQAKGEKQIVFFSNYPETVFDPRGLSGNALKSDLEYLLEKKSILIIFAAENETITYQPYNQTSDGYHPLGPVSLSIYGFYGDIPDNRNLTGKDTHVVLDSNSEFRALLERHNQDAKYSITFTHPHYWEKGEQKKKENFLPLMEGRPDDVVAFAHFRGENITFVFPQIQKKETFLLDFFEKVLPGIVPDIFPFSTQFAWLSAHEYQLPNEANLFKEQEILREEFNSKMISLKERIDSNRQEFGFLHDLLKLSGPELVKAVEKYLKWIGFENVVNVDETMPELMEEDIRVENEKGLLVIEVKGIGGTSSDSECSQISKIRYRRLKERGKFDVSALYMVNHQRFLPPESRKNPPFSTPQIQDAYDDQRGLITTYDLFKLYFNILNGFISKEDARIALFQKGLVEFRPSKALQIPSPILKYGGTVIIFNADGLGDIFVEMDVLLEDSGRYQACKILEIQIDGKPVERTSSGVIGIKISEPAKKKTNLWIRSNQ